MRKVYLQSNSHREWPWSVFGFVHLPWLDAASREDLDLDSPTGKAAGPDRFGLQFFKAFRDVLVPKLLRMIWETFKNKSPPTPTLSEANICVLLKTKKKKKTKKKEKDRVMDRLHYSKTKLSCIIPSSISVSWLRYTCYTAIGSLARLFWFCHILFNFWTTMLQHWSHIHGPWPAWLHECGV